MAAIAAARTRSTVGSTSATFYPVQRELTQRELRNNSGEIMRALDRGDSFVVTRRGVPVGELRPIGRRRSVSAEALLEAFAQAPRIDPERFRADLDAIADQDPTPRA